MASQTSNTARLTELRPIRKLKAIVVNESPVAKYLQTKYFQFYILILTNTIININIIY